MFLDTHVLLWQAVADPRIGPQTLRLLNHEKADGNLGVSVISFWEISMLVSRGRFELDLNLDDWRETLIGGGLVGIPLTGDIAIRAVRLPNLHGDPADRIIVATALEDHHLVTADRIILNWQGELVRVRATD